MRMANVDGRAALVLDGRVLDVEEASGGRLGPDPMVLYDQANQPLLHELQAIADRNVLPQLDPRRLGPPVPHPSKIVGVALNYRSHAEESGAPVPDEPHVFAKFPNCLVGPSDPIVVPRVCEAVDYEAEIVVVMGRTDRGLAPGTAWEAVLGITAGQDISDRAEQFREPLRQFTLAKSYDTFGPLGPVVVTLEELADRDDIGIIGRVDGVEVQRSTSADLIFSVEQLVSWLSRVITFEPGDLIFTGTPAGVGQSRSPQLFLREGMVLETEIPGVGTMRNEVIAG